MFCHGNRSSLNNIKLCAARPLDHCMRLSNATSRPTGVRWRLGFDLTASYELLHIDAARRIKQRIAVTLRITYMNIVVFEANKSHERNIIGLK